MTINFQNILLTMDQVLNVVNTVVDADTPAVLATIPGGVSNSTTGYVELGELGLAIGTQIANAIVAAHAANTTAAAAATSAAQSTATQESPAPAAAGATE